MIDSKDYLIEVLEFFIFKLKRNGCTQAEMEAAAKTIQENMPIGGTISDFAEFYGVPETTVRTNIHRKMFAKPKRVLLYPFQKFVEIVPAKWRKPK